MKISNEYVNIIIINIIICVNKHFSVHTVVNFQNEFFLPKH